MQVEGQHGLSLLSPMATGARVSNAYPTCPLLRDSLLKGSLIPDVVMYTHVYVPKELSVMDGDAFH